MGDTEEEISKLIVAIVNAIRNVDLDIVEDLHGKLEEVVSQMNEPYMVKVMIMIYANQLIADEISKLEEVVKELIEKELESKEKDEISKVLDDALHPRF